METAALCKPIQRFADLLRIPGTWVLTGLGQLLAALGSFPHFPQPLRLLHTHLYWRFLECQSIEVTLTQNGHLTHHQIPSVASLRPGGHFPRIGWPVSPEYAGRIIWKQSTDNGLIWKPDIGLSNWVESDFLKKEQSQHQSVTEVLVKQGIVQKADAHSHPEQVAPPHKE